MMTMQEIDRRRGELEKRRSVEKQMRRLGDCDAWRFAVVHMHDCEQWVLDALREWWAQDCAPIPAAQAEG